MTPEQHKFLKEWIETKQRQLWSIEWECAFAVEHHKDYLVPRAIDNARVELKKLREIKEQLGEDKFTQEDWLALYNAEQKIEDITDTVRTVQKFMQMKEDLTAQIQYFENLCASNSPSTTDTDSTSTPQDS